MEHEDLAGTQLSSIWESLSSDECASGSCTLLPELCCSPETNSSWLPPSHSSTGIAFLQQKQFFNEDEDMMMQDQLLVPNLKLANPGSPCSPLVFNFLQRPLDQDYFSSYEALQLQLEGEKRSNEHQDTLPSVAVLSRAGTSSRERRPRIKEETVAEEDCSVVAKRRCLDKGISDKAEAAAESFMSLSERSVPVLGHALNTDGKPRAKRGSATDPQSVYARHRRERINERLRALQGLVPNGGKVDIVTMLEEAINYVKFLQLQVKLLSSDEHWMYAPTTYNGMNISLGMHLGIQSFMSQV